MSEILNDEPELDSLASVIVQNPASPSQIISSKREALLNLGLEPSQVDQVLSNHENEPIEDLVERCFSQPPAFEDQNLASHAIDFEQITCLICQDSFPFEMMLALECNDQFCKPCLFNYVKLRIVESQVLSMPCPNHECRGQIPDSVIKEHVDAELFNKYSRFKAAEELFKNPYVRGCPKVDCEGYDIGTSERSKLKCNKCFFEYCFYCSEAWHENEQCKNGIDKQMDGWAKEHGLKFCPNCKRKVEKNLGCDHMTCAKCRYEWCWLCGEKYHSGHYEECEVKKLNKKNPAWVFVLRMVFAPFMLPFLCIVICCVFTHKIAAGSMGNEVLRRFVNRYKGISYCFAAFFGIVLSPVFFTVAPFALSIGLNVDCVRNNCCRSSCGSCAGVALGIITAPFLVVGIILGAALAHIFGIVLVLYKIYIAIRRCRDPNFFRPRNRYGYS